MNRIFKTIVQHGSRSLTLLPPVWHAADYWFVNELSIKIVPAGFDSRLVAELPRQRSQHSTGLSLELLDNHADGSVKFGTACCRNSTIDFARCGGALFCWNTKCRFFEYDCWPNCHPLFLSTKFRTNSLSTPHHHFLSMWMAYFLNSVMCFVKLRPIMSINLHSQHWLHFDFAAIESAFSARKAIS